MRVVVLTVFANRPLHPKWMDYVPLLRAQRDSAARFGHKHVVVTDMDLGQEFRQIRTELPADLMPAMIVGAIEGLKAGNGKSHIVIVDADCLVTKNLCKAFFGNMWDLGLTHRADVNSPINNGAMFVSGYAIPQAIAFFERALALCGTHWGADQEAISQAACPVPDYDCVQDRGEGFRIGFLSMKTHAAVPKNPAAFHRSYIVHFKGKRKEDMLDYNERFFAGWSPSE